MNALTKRFGLTIMVLGLFTCMGTARGGIVFNFSGTITEFSNSVTVPTSNGPPVVLPGITDIGPGSTFEGKVFWSYDPNAVTGFPGLVGNAPIIQFSIDHKYLFSSEMMLLDLHPRSLDGVLVPGGSNGQTLSFYGGHGGHGLSIDASLDLNTSSTMSTDATIEARVVDALLNFTSGQFGFDYKDFYGNQYFNGDGHQLELAGNVTSVSLVSISPTGIPIVTPEPATIVSAGIAGVVAVGVAVRRRKRAA
jgi:hypothetical protein